MTNEPMHTSVAESVLENLARTLLYEGYSLYPYYRSAVKNQKPIPFGVVFPKDYNLFHEHSHSKMQSQCIINGSDDLTVWINVRFLHLRKTELYQKNNNDVNEDYVSVFSSEINGKPYQAGWQTIERKISTGEIRVSALLNKSKTFNIEFDNIKEDEIIFNEKNEIEAKQIISVLSIKGSVTIDVDKMEDIPAAFRLTVTVNNTSSVENAGAQTRDEAMCQSFLSTHIILQTNGGEFVSHQAPPEKWEKSILACRNINTWPILIDKSNTTLLSSPIILYDYPEINPQSSGDFFDSTEIEEALLLHVNLLSDEEKKRIGSNDEKLQAMLNKVGSITPEDLYNFHSMMKDSAPGEFTTK